MKHLAIFLSLEGLLTQFFVPLSITGVLYLLIGLVIGDRGRINSGKSGTDNGSLKKNEKRQGKKKKGILMLVLVVLVFTVSWMPLNVFDLLLSFNLIHFKYKTFSVLNWLAMSSVLYNPVICCCLNPAFRKATRIAFLGMVRF